MTKTKTIVWVLSITNLGVTGVYSSPEKAKEAASFQLQCSAVGEEPLWEECYNDTDEVWGYTIFHGHFQGDAEIDAKVLDALY
jgi:hypothetical protein